MEEINQFALSESKSKVKHMKEKMPDGLTPEQRRKIEDEERYEWWMENNPKAKIVPENLREYEPEIKEFEEMIDLFESQYPLAELYAIVDLTPEEAPRHPVREPARLALKPILEKLHSLRDETNISPEKYEALQARWEKIFNAVGVINNNKVYHDR